MKRMFDVKVYIASLGNPEEITRLDLSGKNITHLDEDTFENLTQLEWLFLGKNPLTSLPLVNENCSIFGWKEIERRRKDKGEHWKKWKWVGAEVECFPPCPSNYAHLPVFTKTFLGLEGGVDWVHGLEELEELMRD